MRIRVEIENADKLISNLKKISKNSTRRSLGKAAKAGAEPILKAAKEKAPVDTGRLRDSLRTKFAYQSSKAVRVQVVTNMKPKGKSRLTYDVHQEYGTSHHPAQPFMRPAVDEQKDKAVEETRKTMEEAVLEEVKMLGH